MTVWETLRGIVSHELIKSTPNTTPRTTFFSLPTELRLQIAEYAVQQQPEAQRKETIKIQRWAFEDDEEPSYDERACRGSVNLSILLVCRQFRQDFTTLAWDNTNFVLNIPPSKAIASLPSNLLRHVQKITVPWLLINRRNDWPVIGNNLKLRQLTIVVTHFLTNDRLAPFLRQLANVDTVRMFLDSDQGEPWDDYKSIVKGLWKIDYKARYTDEDAPSVEKSWWEWSFCEEESCAVFVAQNPKPLMDEEAYKILMRPHVEDNIKVLDITCSYVWKRDLPTPEQTEYIREKLRQIR